MTVGSTETGLVGHNLSVADTTPRFKVGTKETIDGIIYRYAKITLSTTAYSFYRLTEEFLLIDRLSTSNDTAGMPVAVPQAVFVGSVSVPVYAFVATGGTGFLGTAAAECAADAAIYTTATNGTVDDATAGKEIPGLRALTAVPAGSAATTDFDIRGEMRVAA